MGTRAQAEVQEREGVGVQGPEGVQALAEMPGQVEAQEAGAVPELAARAAALAFRPMAGLSMLSGLMSSGFPRSGPPNATFNSTRAR